MNIPLVGIRHKFGFYKVEFFSRLSLFLLLAVLIHYAQLFSNCSVFSNYITRKDNLLLFKDCMYFDYICDLGLHNRKFYSLTALLG